MVVANAVIAKSFRRGYKLVVRFTQSERDLIRSAARESRSVSDYIRGVVLASADEDTKANTTKANTKTATSSTNSGLVRKVKSKGKR